MDKEIKDVGPGYASTRNGALPKMLTMKDLQAAASENSIIRF